MLNEFLVHKSGRTRWESTWQPCNRQPNGDANPTHHPPAHVSSAAQLHLLPDYGVLSCLCLCAHVRARACFVPWALKGPLPPPSSSTFLRPNGELSLRNGFGFGVEEERSMRLGRRGHLVVRSFFPSKAVPSVLCKRRSSGSGATASEQADRQLDNGSRLGKIRGKQERERKERASERYSSYVAKATRGGRERMAALIVIRVRRAKRTNFMSQPSHIHRSIAL